MEEDVFSPEDGLQVIQAMINRAKESVADNSYYFLLWGWTVFIACLGQFVLKVIVGTPYHPWVWSINLVAIVLSMVHGFREEKKVEMKSYVDETLDNIWMGIGGCYILLVVAFSGIGWENCFTFYMMLYGLGAFLTGRILKFPILIWGAAASWILSIVSAFTSFDVGMLLSSVAIIFSNILPGYLLRRKYKSQ